MDCVTQVSDKYVNELLPRGRAPYREIRGKKRWNETQTICGIDWLVEVWQAVYLVRVSLIAYDEISRHT